MTNNNTSFEVLYTGGNDSMNSFVPETEDELMKEHSKQTAGTLSSHKPTTASYSRKKYNVSANQRFRDKLKSLKYSDRVLYDLIKNSNRNRLTTTSSIGRKSHNDDIATTYNSSMCTKVSEKKKNDKLKE